MRQVLRYPVGQNYRQIMNDPFEWFVITDLRLNPIVMERGIKGKITPEVQKDAYYKLLSISKGKSIRVYILHTHPGHYRSALSDSDIKAAIISMTVNLESLGIIIVGNGVITDKEIVIMKLPQNKKQVSEMQENLPGAYDSLIYFNLKKVVDRKGGVDKYPDEVWNKHVDIAAKKALKTIAKNEKHVTVKTVRRTHREMRRR